MEKQYPSSVFSQKSTISALSGRSLFSMASGDKSSTIKNGPISQETGSGFWNSLRSLIPSSKLSPGKRNDQDYISGTSIRINDSSSFSKLKNMLISPIRSKAERSKVADSSESIDISSGGFDSSIESSSIYDRNSPVKVPHGILIHRGDESAEAIEERKRRRSKRRQDILRLQNNNTSFHSRYASYRSTEHDSADKASLATLHKSSNELYKDNLLMPPDHTIDRSFTPPFSHQKPMVSFCDDNDDQQNNLNEFNPGIMFIEPSPIPRFRNVAPPPPPSPPYMDIQIHNAFDETTYNSMTTIQSQSMPLVSNRNIKNNNNNATIHEEEYMYFMEDHLRNAPSKKLHLYFYAPFLRGQTMKFSLINLFPDENIVLYKFLTSNSSDGLNAHRYHTKRQSPERYFVQPSAGRLTSGQPTDIILYLNQVPLLRPDEVMKDKVIIKWVVIQKDTEIEAWVNSLHDSTRRKWIDMLEEEWSDQIFIRMTTIKIRFMS